MVRKLGTIITVLFLIMSFSVSSYALTNISENRTTVINSLPQVNIYMDTDKDYNATKDNTIVSVNDETTNLEFVGPFHETGDEITYYLLIDLSRSISEEDFSAIQSGIIEFTKMINSNDNIILVPFGEDVYADNKSYKPSDESLKEEIDKLKPEDDYTQLYNAIDSANEMCRSRSGSQDLSRKVALVFTDGADITTGGYVNDEELANNMKSTGLPLYGFVVGENRDAKDRLGVLCRNLNGDIVSIDENNITEELEAFNKVINNTLTIKTSVRNSESIGLEFNIRVAKDGRELLVKDGVQANKTEASKDVFFVAVKKFCIQYWWVVIVIAAVLIATIVLLVIRKNNGVMIVDGKVVYGSKVQKRYHVQVKEYNTKEMLWNISIDGKASSEQKISVVESIIVGRAKICDVYFDDLHMSRQHFCIEISNDNFYITDLNSTAGTYLNGIKVYGKQRITSGDQINAGRTEIKIN